MVQLAIISYFTRIQIYFQSRHYPYLFLTAKQQHSVLDGSIKPLRYLYALPNLNVVPEQATKKGNSGGSMGSKSKTNLMKSYKINKKQVEPKLKKQKKENALDIISKSILKTFLKGSGRPLLIFKSFIMRTIKNHVQLIGNVGHDPEVTNLESGKKMVRFSLATNEHYKNANEEKKTDTNWHSIVAWGKTAEIVENYVEKGKEIGVSGKLRSRTYEDEEGVKRTITEIIADEILLLGLKGDQKTGNQ